MRNLSPKLRLLAPLALVGALLLSGCSDPEPVRMERAETPRASAPAAAGSVDQRRAAFLNRIREADPDKATIERALINEDNELGLILSRKTNLDEVPKLLRSMLTQMHEAFPDQNLTAVAYAPTDPPREIGTARLDVRTRDMTYQPASSP